MNLSYTKRFVRSLRGLTPEQAAGAAKALQLFMEDTRHPSLNFEKVQSTSYCTIRVNQGDRIALRRTGSQAYDVVDVGSHDYIYRKYG